ncbi:hypothetical protein V1511DRAFT_523203 [Dipodascopsis uninucleata]
MVFTLRWGLAGAGIISTDFVRDLQTDPSTRGVSDVKHVPVAIGARDLARAQRFVADNALTPEAKATMKAYGNYDDLINDPDVDIIYVGTTSPTHYTISLAALRAGKHVLCEKAFTFTADQAKHLVKVAKERKLYLLEGVWTRFFPLTIEYKRLIHEEKILGPIRRVFADFSVEFPSDLNNRIHDYEGGGGCVLDLCVYSLVWVYLTCCEHPENGLAKPDSISASCVRSRLSNVEESVCIATAWNKPNILGISTSHIMMNTPEDNVVRVQGDLGEIIVGIHGAHPNEINIKLKGQPPKKLTFDIPAGTGLFWEADACARDIRDGKIESDIYPLSEAIMSMEIMDTWTFKAPNDIAVTEDVR